MNFKTRPIILCGGSGTRLSPLTKSVNKQLLPINDKPMIFYPISFSIMSNIRDVLIITNREYLDNYKRLFGKGDNLGMDIKYKMNMVFLWKSFTSRGYFLAPFSFFR